MVKKVVVAGLVVSAFVASIALMGSDSTNVTIESCQIYEATDKSLAQISFFTDRHPVNGHFHGAANGPGGVVRSVVAGMNKVGIQINVDPLFPQDIAQTVVVLGGYRGLCYVMEQKRLGRVKKLIVGPNVDLLFNQERINLTASPLIDAFLVPCEWAKNVWVRYAPATKSRIHTWYAGVDETYWSPSYEIKRPRNIMVYVKSLPAMGDDVVRLARNRGFAPIVIEYGFFSQQHYKEALRNVACAIFLSHSESQGIALAEAWSMNVPTLVWNPKRHESPAFAGIETSSAPYLTPATGVDWQTYEQLGALLDSLSTLLPTFEPRAWVLNNMTDAIAAQKLLDLIRSL